MARIRTVKPQLFRHEELFELEKESKLPLRVAWMGLFTVVDRDGRFEWKPKILKLDILPWDNLDFANVLNALEKGGLIKRYQVDGKTYGFIPTWHRHQTVHHTEVRSRLPEPLLPNGEPTVNPPLNICEPPLDSRKEEEKEEEQKCAPKNHTKTLTTSLWEHYKTKLQLEKQIEACKSVITNTHCKSLVEQFGLEKAKQLVDVFLEDKEKFVLDQAYPIGLLVSQKQKYLARLGKVPISTFKFPDSTAEASHA